MEAALNKKPILSADITVPATQTILSPSVLETEVMPVNNLLTFFVSLVGLNTLNQHEKSMFSSLLRVEKGAPPGF